jgi:glutamyl/glutaminyl-tRNA synthetase
MAVRVLYKVPALGSLDLTSARAALYGWLVARHERGTFVLYVSGSPPAAESLLDELRLLGLDWEREIDERPAGITHVFCDLRQPVGGEPPQIVRLPPVEGPEAGIAVREWVRRGYSGLALANCLARLGWSPRGKRSFLTLDELAARFDLGRLSRRPVLFERQQLDWFNRRWLGALDVDEVTALLVPHWQAAYARADRAEGTALAREVWQQTLALAIREELYLPAQAADKARFAFVDELSLDAASRAALDRPCAKPILRAFVDELPAVAPFEFGLLDTFCSELRLRFKESLGVRSRDVMHVLRAALTGRQDGPCLVVACQLLGPARCVQRAQWAIHRSASASSKPG